MGTEPNIRQIRGGIIAPTVGGTNGQVLTSDGAQGTIWVNADEIGGVVGFSSNWTLSVVTAIADPGAGEIRTNDALNLTTALAVSTTTNNGSNASTILDTLTEDDVIVFQNSGVSSDWVKYRITGSLTNNTSWFEIPVEFIEDEGTLAKGESLFVRFSYGVQAGIGVRQEGSPVVTTSVLDFSDNFDATDNGGVGDVELGPDIEIPGSGTFGDPLRINSSSVGTGALRVDGTGATQVISLLMTNDSGGVSYETSSDGSGIIRQNSPTGAAQDVWISCARDGAVALNFNNSTVFQTIASGVSVTGDVNASGDLTQSINTTDTVIHRMGNTAGAMEQQVQPDGDLVIQQRSIGGSFENNWAVFNRNGPVRLFYNGTAKFNTESNGVSVTDTNLNVNGVSYSWPGADGSNRQALTTSGASTLTWQSFVPLNSVGAEVVTVQADSQGVMSWTNDGTNTSLAFKHNGSDVLTVDQEITVENSQSLKFDDGPGSLLGIVGPSLGNMIVFASSGNDVELQGSGSSNRWTVGSETIGEFVSTGGSYFNASTDGTNTSVSLQHNGSDIFVVDENGITSTASNFSTDDMETEFTHNGVTSVSVDQFALNTHTNHGVRLRDPSSPGFSQGNIRLNSGLQGVGISLHAADLAGADDAIYVALGAPEGFTSSFAVKDSPGAAGSDVFVAEIENLVSPGTSEMRAGFFNATPVTQQTFDSSDTDTNRIAALEALVAAYGLGVDTA